MVRLSKQLDYLVNAKSSDFLAYLPTVDLPTSSKLTHRAFEMNDGEMEYHQNGIHRNDILLGKLLTSNEKALVGKVYILVTHQIIRIRRLYSKHTDAWTMKSDNPNYAIQNISLSEMKEIWEVKGVFSQYLHSPKMLEERVMLIENQLQVLLDKLTL